MKTNETAFYEDRKSRYRDGLRIDCGPMNNYSYGAHWHPEIELMLITDGEFLVGINNQSKCLKKGEIAICPSGHIHYLNSQKEPSNVLFIIFHPEIIKDLVPQIPFTTLFIDSETAEDAGMQTGIFGEIRGIMYNIYEERKKKDYYSQTIAKSYVVIMMGLLLRYLPQSLKGFDKVSTKSRVALMQKALTYIEQNFTSDISLNSISSFLGVSPYYFSRTFSEFSGESFKKYLNNFRVMKSKDLLNNTDESILEISLECGFNSIRTFNRVFREITGDIPRSIRKRT